MKEFKEVRLAWQKIEIFSLTQEEKAGLSLINTLDPTLDSYLEKLTAILKKCCKSILSLSRMAVYSPQVRQWCENNENMATTWRKSLAELGEEKVFHYQFKKQKKLADFSLLAGLLLFYEYLHEENEANKMIILFIAMQSFHSFHAAYILANRGLRILSQRQDQILLNKLMQMLEVIATKHGSPGYLLLAIFTYQISGIYSEKNPNDKRISSFMHVCFRFLLTAQILEKNSINEMANADFGKGDLFHRAMVGGSSKKKSAIKLSELINIFAESKLVKPIAEIAQAEAKQLARSYNLS